MPVFEDLAGKSVFVTGGARGLGYAIAEGLAQQGCNVALADLLDGVEDSARTLAEQYGVKAVGIRTDVTDAAQVDAAFAQADAELGTIEVLMAVAGITLWGDSVDTTPEEWRKVFAVCTDGTFFAAQSWARRLLAREATGSAVFISSMSGRIANVPQAQAAYNSAKAAVDMLAKSLGVEWASRGLRVNAVAPGYFMSEMTKQFTDKNPDLYREWNSLTPLGRFGVPDDLKGITAFLASDASSYITGSSMLIDGGYVAR
ncbi:MAG: SDR family oxidoreductase [Microbacterium sp.]